MSFHDFLNFLTILNNLVYFSEIFEAQKLEIGSLLLEMMTIDFLRDSKHLLNYNPFAEMFFFLKFAEKIVFQKIFSSKICKKNMITLFS